MRIRASYGSIGPSEIWRFGDLETGNAKIMAARILGGGGPRSIH